MKEIGQEVGGRGRLKKCEGFFPRFHILQIQSIYDKYPEHYIYTRPIAFHQEGWSSNTFCNFAT